MMVKAKAPPVKRKSNDKKVTTAPVHLKWTGQQNVVLWKCFVSAAGHRDYGAAMDDTDVLQQVISGIKLDPAFVGTESLLIPSRVRSKLSELASDKSFTTTVSKVIDKKPPAPTVSVVTDQFPATVAGNIVEPDMSKRLDNLYEKLGHVTAVFDKVVYALHTVNASLLSLEQATAQHMSLYQMVSEMYADLTGKPPPTTPTNPTSVDIVSSAPSPEVPSNPTPVLSLSPDAAQSEIDEFVSKYAGKRFGIVGGNFDENQCRRLKEKLKIEVHRDLWLGGSRPKIMGGLTSFVSPDKIDMLFIFYPKAVAVAVFQVATALASKHGIPCVDHSSLDPKQVAIRFNKFCRNKK